MRFILVNIPQIPVVIFQEVFFAILARFLGSSTATSQFHHFFPALTAAELLRVLLSPITRRVFQIWSTPAGMKKLYLCSYILHGNIIPMVFLLNITKKKYVVKEAI